MALRNTPAWEALVAHQHGLDATHLRSLFASDRQRAARLTTQVGDLTIDFSKHLVTDATLGLLTQLVVSAIYQVIPIMIIFIFFTAFFAL